MVQVKRQSMAVKDAHELNDRILQANPPITHDPDVAANPQPRLRKIPNRQGTARQDDDVAQLSGLGQHHWFGDDPRLVLRLDPAGRDE